MLSTSVPYSPKCVERLSGKSLHGSNGTFLGSAKRPKRCSFAPFCRLKGSRSGARSEFPDSLLTKVGLPHGPSLTRTGRTSARGGGGRYAHLLRGQRHANRTALLPRSLIVLVIRADADEHLAHLGSRGRGERPEALSPRPIFHT